MSDLFVFFYSASTVAQMISTVWYSRWAYSIWCVMCSEVV